MNAEPDTVAFSRKDLLGIQELSAEEVVHFLR